MRKLSSAVADQQLQEQAAVLRATTSIVSEADQWEPAH